MTGITALSKGNRSKYSLSVLIVYVAFLSLFARLTLLLGLLYITYNFWVFVSVAIEPTVLYYALSKSSISYPSLNQPPTPPYIDNLSHQNPLTSAASME